MGVQPHEARKHSFPKKKGGWGPSAGGGEKGRRGGTVTVGPQIDREEEVADADKSRRGEIRRGGGGEIGLWGGKMGLNQKKTAKEGIRSRRKKSANQ